MTKDYTVSGFAYPLRMPKTLVASQFVWEGITYKEPKGLSVCAAIYETGGAYFDSFVARCSDSSRTTSIGSSRISEISSRDFPLANFF